MVITAKPAQRLEPRPGCDLARGIVRVVHHNEIRFGWDLVRAEAESIARV